MLILSVPMADTMLSNVPPVPVGGQALQIDCSSAVPQDLQGQVTVTRFGPDGSMLAIQQGPLMPMLCSVSNMQCLLAQASTNAV